MSEGGFTLVEVVIALAIIALTALVLLDRRMEVVQDAGRARDLKTAWTLAARKLAELELDRTLWVGEGVQTSGDFGEYDPALANYTWEFMSARVPVETVDPLDLKPGQKQKELFRAGLKVECQLLGEPILLEMMLPVDEPKPPSGAQAPAAPGTPSAPAPAPTPAPLPGPRPKGPSK